MAVVSEVILMVLVMVAGKDYSKDNGVQYAGCWRTEAYLRVLGW